jgi:hypothetical protein
MVLQYVSRQADTTVLPKKFVKSLRYTTVLCILIVDHLLLKAIGTNYRNYFDKKNEFCAKNGKT